MGRTSFTNFGRAAGRRSPTTVAGRYRHQSDDERLIVGDVAAKLEIGPGDALLEVGCGPGTPLIPPAFVCRPVPGTAPPDVVRYVSRRFAGPPEITLIPGNFLDLELDATYTKVLAYN